MKNFTLVHETPSHFVLHNGIAKFHVAKHGLDTPTADKIRSLARGGLVTPDNALNQVVQDKGIVGGTIKDGSDEERFHFHNLTFDIDKARDISKKKANGEVEVSPKWLDKIRLDKEAALASKSDNPVFIAQVHSPQGLKPLLIDGNHRMYKAVHEGKKTIPAYIFTPEQTLSLMTDKFPKSELRAAVKKDEAEGKGPQLVNGSDYSPKKMAGGGEAQSPEEAGIEAVAKKEATLKNAGISPSQSDDEIQIEAEEKKRRGYDDGGAVQSFQDSFRKATHYDNGGTINDQIQIANNLKDKSGRITQQDVDNAKHYANGGGPDDDSTPQDKAIAALRKVFSPAPTPTPQPTPDSYEEIRRRSRLSITDPSNPEAYAQGGSIANETQSQAIKRHADGNPANLAHGGHMHHQMNQGKNTLHFHFYDGAVVPTPLDKEMGAGSSPQATPLDKYVHLDEGTTSGDVAAAADDQMSDSDKLAQAAQDVQSGLDSQVPQAAPMAQANPNVVPPEQQISAAPKALPKTPDQQPDLLNQLNSDIQGEQNAILGGANEQAKGFAAQAQAIQSNLDQQQKANVAYQNEVDNITKQNTQLFDNVRNNIINPNQFWEDKSTGGKIAAGIALLLGGISSGLTGKSNPALDVIQNQIQRDIEAQKSNQAQAVNLYKLGLEKYRDTQAAHQYATLQANALLQGQLSKISAQTGSQTAKFNAQQAIHQIGLQNAELRSQLGLRQAAMSSMNQAPSNAPGVNPDKLRLLTMAGVIPKDEAPTADKELGEYQKLSNSLDEVDNVFKNAHNDATYTQRISEGLPGGSLFPTVRDRSKKFLAETNALLDKYTKDLTGRVTPQSMQNLSHSIPAAGDSPDVMNRKLNSFKDIVREAYSFPTLTKYRLLNPNDPIIQSSATRQKRFTEGPPK